MCRNFGGKTAGRYGIYDRLESAVSGKAYLILAVPSVFTRSTAKSMAPFVKEGQIIVCVAKGIEEETLMPLTDIVEQEIPQAEVAVMCGPSHAEEVGIGLPTTVVAGAKKRAVAEEIQDIFMNNVFRVYTSPDVLGMELGGSLKNVIRLQPEWQTVWDMGITRKRHSSPEECLR